MGQRWVDNDLVFATRYGTELDGANVRRVFRTVAAAAGLEASEWTPRELLIELAGPAATSVCRRRG